MLTVQESVYRCLCTVQISITNENVLESVAKIRGIKYQLNVDRLRQLADQEYWYESPALVDAYYVPQRNEMGKKP